MTFVIHSLGNSVHRTLLLRLCLMTVVVAIILGTVGYFVERGRVLDTIQFNTQQKVQLFNARVMHLFLGPGQVDKAAMQWELDEFAASRTRRRSGHFVIVRIDDMAGRPLASLENESGVQREQARADLDLWMRSAPQAEKGAQEAVQLGGRLLVRVALELTDGNGEAMATVAGIFALSEEAISDIRQRTLRAALLVIVIVLLTAALLYPVIVSLTSRLSRFSEALLDANLETLQLLGGAIAKRDSDTNAHNYRVTILSVRLAEALGLETQVIQGLIKGAFLHDVGKVAIRDAVLLKPGRLDAEEFEHMKTHVSHGLEIVSRSSWLSDARDVVQYHHEKFDGSGYDSGLKSEGIPVTARIFAIADVFDALTSRRPYKEPFSFEQAMDILEEGRGNHFDPNLLDAFAGIARPIYDRMTVQDDATTRADLETITQRYFFGGLDQIA